MAKRANDENIPAPRRRMWQLDALRGAAMLLMAAFHALVDLRDFFGVACIEYARPPLSFIGRSAAVLFIVLAGASCRLSRSNARRGARVLAGGLAITAVTWLFPLSRAQYVRFGILHFLGTAMIIAAAMQRLMSRRRGIWGKPPLDAAVFVAASSVSMLAAAAIDRVIISTPLLIPFGVMTPGFSSYDYYPLFPWLGLFFAGAAAGGAIVRGSPLQERLAQAIAPAPFSFLSALGRRSFAFYFIHQPVIFFTLWLWRQALPFLNDLLGLVAP